MRDGHVVWMYAVTRESGCGTPPSVLGVAGENVRVLVEGSLAALVGSVDSRRFGPESLTGNLEDLDWLADKARIHDAVIAAVAASGPVVPLRLATLFSSDDGVRQLLRHRGDEFRRALDAVTGRTEWGVKAYVDPESLADTLSAQHGQGAGEITQRGQSAGSAYLLRRRAQLAARESAESTATAWSRQIHAQLREVCAASRLHPAQDPRLTGRKDWMILNAAYLVDQERTEPFHALVQQFTEWQEGLNVELTGPWPPYSFAAAPGDRHD
ncbi:MAG TPA: GvpL/GvpF family gas vesicle protein [Actinocrinis sp.]|nr:GvpL/GvpF family gas vesicle protein [Actinocrinis sp.]HZU59159.1 GvpL/GvpF family gas vesicle protein [Actinocrinis sp.]